MGIEEIILSIHEAEMKADGILNDAAEQAKSVRMEADKETERILKEMSEKQKSSARLMASNAEVAAAAKGNERLNLGRKEAKKVYDAAMTKVDEAAEYIVRRFAETYGDR